jgi:hypothetical protein
MTIRRLSIGAGFKYLLKSIAIGDGPDEQSQVSSVELSFEDEQVNSYQPLSGEELDVMSSFADVESQPRDPMGVTT